MANIPRISDDEDDDVQDVHIKDSSKNQGSSSTDLADKDTDMKVEDEDEDDLPLTSRKRKSSSAKVNYMEESDDDKADQDSDEDVPLASRKKQKTAARRASSASKSSKKATKEISSSVESSPAPSPVPKKRKSSASTATKVKKETKKKSKAPAPSVSSSPEKTQTPKKKADDVNGDVKPENAEDEESEEYKWWLDQNKDDSMKWNTLEHSGPYFPPPYVPHGVKMKYDGKEVSLSPPSEEVATFFAGVVGTDWGENVTFQKNFFADWQKVLQEHDPNSPIKEFSKCDFTPLVDYLAQLKEKKKSMTKAEKAAIKEEKAKLDEQYAWAHLDGRKEKVGNYRIEPPGLFRGRGEHPKTGALKLRVMPEQVTLNIGKDAKIPDPPAGHNWGGIVHDNTVTWLAMWKENVNDSFKYVFLAATSSLKGQSDLKKFEKARELKSHVTRIRDDYLKELKHEEMFVRQRATALYFIDRLALRAGNEKGEDEADTVGCCSLRIEHLTLEPPNKVIFDFLGKDSIRYYNEVEVEPQVFKNLKIFKKDPKVEGDDLFDRLNTSLLNKHLNSYMKGLTAKVFRTYNASHTFQEELKKTPEDGTVAEKILAYNRANRQVAILCNHQRSVPKAHGNQMAKLKDKILAVKYERAKVKEQMLDLDPKLKKSRPELAEPESDLDDEFIERHEVALAEKEKEALQKKLIKENEKRKEQGLELLTAVPKEWEKKKSAGLSNMSLEKLEKKYTTLTDRIQTQKMSLIDKDENKTTALGTSKINYIDPRISAAWCKKYDVPLEKIFNRSLREKFKWAMDAAADWHF